MGNYSGILGFARQQIRNNPQLANNPQAQDMIQAIENGDEQAGIQLANNILKSYGLSKEQGIAMALQRIRFPNFGGGR